jgi:hypothetical protein
MATILPLLMGEMVLIAVIAGPLLVRSQEVRPGFSLLEPVNVSRLYRLASSSQVYSDSVRVKM